MKDCKQTNLGRYMCVLHVISWSDWRVKIQVTCKYGSTRHNFPKSFIPLPNVQRRTRTPNTTPIFRVKKNEKKINIAIYINLFLNFFTKLSLMGLFSPIFVITKSFYNRSNQSFACKTIFKGGIRYDHETLCQQSVWPPLNQRSTDQDWHIN